MTKQSFLHLLSKEISGNLSPNEQELLNESLKENETFRHVHTEMHRFMKSETEKSTMDVEAKLDEVWRKINSGEQTQYASAPIKKRIVPVWVRVAASIVIVIGLGWVVTHNYLSQQNMYSETLHAENENLYAVLDDGTQVWLGKHSQIDYNNKFGEKIRKIRLTGEAFFDVAHNAEVPLTVTANDVEVLVKGTAFNVNAQASDVEVALIRGLVAVKPTKQKNEREVLLHPNQKILVRNRKVASNDSNYVVLDMQSVKDSTITEIKWMDDVLVFHKQRFADLAKLLETRFDVKITFRNPAIAEQRFTGSIKNESLVQILDALKQSYPFEYAIENNHVTIK